MTLPGQAEVLILGGPGALGHKLFQLLRPQFPETCCTIRGLISDPPLRRIALFQNGNVIERVDAADFPGMEELLRKLQPRVVVNCIGITKQRPETKNVVASLTINSLLPHKLAEFCARTGARLIHFSTDCVFSGKKGHYCEDDVSDAEDIYGRTKFLGELPCESGLTLRTSFIGRELTHHASLLEWFLKQNHGRVRGYTNALFSGVTSIWLAKVVADLIRNNNSLSGVYQVAGPTISKFDLLCQVRDAFRLDIEIVPDPSFRCDRSMVGEKFERATGYTCPPWTELVTQLVRDPTPYEQWKDTSR